MNTKDKKYGFAYSNCEKCGVYRPTEKGICEECVKHFVMVTKPDFEYDTDPERCSFTIGGEDDDNRQCARAFGHDGNHETVPIVRCAFADFTDRMAYVQCCLQLGHRGNHKQPSPLKCIVMNCENTNDLGSFTGVMCDPCHVFITKGEGLDSQAYRNAMKTYGEIRPKPATLTALWHAVDDIMKTHRTGG